MSVYIIAEAGVNHNGDYELAKALCLAAKNAGADAVKFQTWKTEKIVTRATALASYQVENLSSREDSQFEMLKKLELSYETFRELQKYCNGIGIQFLSTPDEEESLHFLVSLGLPFIKVGSGEILNIPYLRQIGAQRVPVLLSTGMSTLGDVDRAYRTLLEAGASSVALLHCTTNYPCPWEEVNLSAMCTLKEAFKCEVGYSDHTLGVEVPVAAVALGATIIEKHFTLDNGMEGPDHKASLNPRDFERMVKEIRHIETALGDGIKRPNKSEVEIAKVVQKRIVAKRHISKGEILTESNLTVKRAPDGLSPLSWDVLLGSKALKDYSEDEPILLTK